MATRPIVVAHRGLHAHDPENSLSAIRAAHREGIEACEFDVQASSDNVPIILHDDTLDRTAVKTGSVNTYRASELAEIRLRRPDGSVHWGHVPVLSPRTFIGLLMTFLVEVKPPDAGQLVKNVYKALDGWDNWMLQSFDARNLIHGRKYRRSFFPADHAVLVETQAALEEAIRADWPSVHADHRLVNETTVQRLHKRRRRIGVWTVNTAEDLKRVIRLGVDRIITDEPLLARVLVNQHFGAAV